MPQLTGHALRAQRFPIGTPVLATHPDRYLRERHGVVGWVTVGVVAGHSRLNDDDSGVIVDWGNNLTVRCDVEELEATTADPN